jgi:hypothetical protein
MQNLNRLFISALDCGGLVEYSVERGIDSCRPIVKVRYRVFPQVQAQADDMGDEFCHVIARSLNCVIKENLHGDTRHCLYLIPLEDRDPTVEFIAA